MRKTREKQRSSKGVESIGEDDSHKNCPSTPANLCGAALKQRGGNLLNTKGQALRNCGYGQRRQLLLP